jgi:uncharacterized protein HemX
VEVRVSAGVLREAAARRAARWETPRRDRDARRARVVRGLGNALLVAAVAASLSVVVWRQTEGTERQRELSRLREERSIAAAERTEWENRILALQTRTRITRVARERLGLHVARDDQVVLLPVPAAALEGRP